MLVTTKETWKDIEGYEGKYRVSDRGNVMTVQKGRLLKPCVTDLGYARVTLSSKGRAKAFRIHRLVAQAFIANPDNLPEVNHMDEDKLNNSMDNLEWCTRAYNNQYRTPNSKPRVGKGVNKGNTGNRRKNPIVGTHKITGEKIYFEGLGYAKDAGFPNVRAVIGKYGKKGKRRTRYGYIWDYQPKSTM